MITHVFSAGVLPPVSAKNMSFLILRCGAPVGLCGRQETRGTALSSLQAPEAVTHRMGGREGEGSAWWQGHPSGSCGISGDDG